MEIKASLNNLRIAPRKIRSVTDLIKGMTATQAKSQLSFLVKKPAPVILKLLNSAVANAKHNFSLSEDNLCIVKILVEPGRSLKRWLPRAMGRATPIMKRTCSVKLVLAEISPTAVKIKRRKKPTVIKAAEALPPAPEEKIEQVAEERKEEKPKISAFAKPYDTSGQAKKRYFSRQAWGNIKKVFRRKSI